MSFRNRFPRQEQVRRVTRRALRHDTIAAYVESLETRTLLSAVLPGLDQHGVVFNNASVAGRQSLVVNASMNNQLSDNAQGSGLFIDLNNLSGQLNSLQSIQITDVTIANNGNAGAQIRLSNMTLQRLVIDRAAISGNGGAGLVLTFTNVQLGELIIWDSRNPSAVDPESPNLPNDLTSSYSGNAFDGICFLGTLSNVGTWRMLGNVIDGNQGHGAFFNLNAVNIGDLVLNDNEVRTNLGSGFQFVGNRTSVADGEIIRNTITGNLTNAGAGGHGISFFTQALIGSVLAPDKSNIDFTLFEDNVITDNAGSGVLVDLRAQTTWDATLLRNDVSRNQQRGFDLRAIDTEGAFDVTIGSLAINPQLQLIDGNTFIANVGAAIALDLNDSSGNAANATARFRILGNTIAGTGILPGSLIYRGEGINIRARGSVTLQNGAARYFSSVIDRNTISGNAGDGVRINVSEDSELIDLTIGNSIGAEQTFDVNGPDIVGGGNISTVAGDGNVISNNGGNGVSIVRLSSAFVRNARILDNIITSNQEGIYLQASNTYITVPNAARPSAETVNDFTINNNDLSSNRSNGVHLRTEADAVILANIRYNRIDGNALNGILTTGLENNITDFENIGGAWVKNAITNNGTNVVRAALGLAPLAAGAEDGNGIRIANVVGSVNPLIIGRDGQDAVDQQSLGNFIAFNGSDGIEVGARGQAGTVMPRDIRDALEIINNHIIENGRNGVGSPYTAGKGIDIEVLGGNIIINAAGQSREFRIDRNVIQGNAGDGIELRNAGGQLRLTAQGNFIDLNGGRGVDLLNQPQSAATDAEAYVRFGGPNAADRNVITNNGLEGFYVVNTSTPDQTQDVDAVAPLLTWSISGPPRVEAGVTVNLVLDVENNEIRDNGLGVPALGSPASTLSGTGLVLRVGSQYSAGDWDTVADLTGNEFVGTNAAAGGVGTNEVQNGGTVGFLYTPSANGRVNARVVDNEFSGNVGDDVLIEGFVSLLPRSTTGEWSAMFFRNINVYDRDPLARLNLEFHGNTGDSIDVVRGSTSNDGQTAAYSNGEGDFKSRTGNRTAPDPNGPFGTNATRARLVTRVADRPTGFNGGLIDAYENGGFFTGSSSQSAPNNGPNVPIAAALSIASIDATNLNGPIIVTVGSRSATVADATNANPSVITSVSHRLNTGDQITITGATGNTAINGTWIVEVLSGNTFQLRDLITNALVAGNGTYNAGSATWTLLGQHRFSTGDVVTISGTGVFNANGVHMVQVIDAARFALWVPSSFTVPVPGNGFNGASGGTVLQHNPGKFQYDGVGPSTFRVEGNVDFSGFTNIQQGTVFGVSLSEPTSPTFISWDEVRADTFSFLTASISDILVNRAAGTATLTVTLSEPAKEFTSVFYSTSDGTAKAGSDYVTESGFITFNVGQTQRTITIDLGAGGALDGIEQFYVDLSSISAGNFVDSRGIVTLIPPSLITIDDVTEFEGDAGTKTLTFTVTLSSDPGTTVTVDYDVIGQTATAGSDFVVNSGQLIFQPGETSKQITVTVNGDVNFESDETFIVRLSNAANATIAKADGIGTILDDDTPNLTISNPVVNEGDGPGAIATFTLVLSKQANVPVTLNFNTADATAIAGQDYVARTGSITFQPGETIKTVDVAIIGDTTLELLENFTLNLTNVVNANPPAGPGQAAIIDDDTPMVTVGPVTVVEGDVPGVARFTVTLSKSAGVPVTVDFTTADGSATAGEDYLARTGQLVFNPGETSKTIDVSIVGDRLIEGTETFQLNLTGTVNGNIITPSAVGTITDDDTPSITIDDVGVLENEGGAVLTITLSKPTATDTVTVDIGTRDGSATAGSDYLARFFTLVFAPGVTLQTIFIPITSDSTGEGVETFFVDLLGATNAVIAKPTGTVRILDATNTIGLVTSPNAGFAPLIKVYDARGDFVRLQFHAYSPAFTLGVKVATGDVNGDGITDIIAAPVRGQAPIRVFDGASGALLQSFFPFGVPFAGGVSIAVADVNLDGRADIIAAQSSQGGSVRIFDGGNGSTLASYFAYSPAFMGGVNVAAGDVNDDLVAEVIVAPASGAAPIFVMNALTGGLLAGYFPYSVAFTGGVNVAAGDVNNDGRAEVIAAPFRGAAPIFVFNALAGTLRSGWFPYGTAFTGGVNVGVGDVDFDGRAEVIASPASGSAAVVLFFDATTGRQIKVTYPYPLTFAGGAFVAGQTLPPEDPGQPLRLAGDALANSAEPAVAQATVDGLAEAAIRRLAAAGASADDLAKLATVEISVADLPGAYLGIARPGAILIDVNAGGHGWFVDATPDDDVEFARGTDGVYRGVVPQAQGKIDLLTVLTHELAHRLGFKDLDPVTSANSLMTATLGKSVRRATKEHLDDLFTDGEILNELLTV